MILEAGFCIIRRADLGHENKKRRMTSMLRFRDPRSPDMYRIATAFWILHLRGQGIAEIFSRRPVIA